jgi:predicted metal-dependent enzyme (double-stranded beta helix superfamily)
MNNYSFEELINILSSNKIKDAKELYTFIDNFEVYKDEFIKTRINSYTTDINSKTYFRDSLFYSDRYSVILIFWNPWSESPIHYHPKKGCLMKVLKGSLTVDLYDDTDFSTIQHESTTVYRENFVTYIKGLHGIHKITNDSNDLAITLHIYINNKA